MNGGGASDEFFDLTPRRSRSSAGSTRRLRRPWTRRGVHDRFKEIVANIATPNERSPEYLRRLVESETAKMGAAIRGIQQV